MTLESPIEEVSNQSDAIIEADVVENFETEESNPPTKSKSSREALSKALDGISFGDDDERNSAPDDDSDNDLSSDAGANDGGGEESEGQGDSQGDLPAPSRFNKAAKEAWANTDPVMKAEITRAVEELESGLSQKSEALKPIQGFLDLADEQKVDPAEVIQGYIDIERLLYQNPRDGFLMLGQKMGLNVPQMVQLLTGQHGPQQHKQPDGNQYDPRDQQIVDLRNEINSLRNDYQQVNNSIRTQAEQNTLSQLEVFATDHPRMDELSDEIVRQIESGFDLNEAYQRAERLNPLPTVETERTQATAQTRQRKSVTGTSKGGSNPTKVKSKSSREALERAFSGLSN